MIKFQDIDFFHTINREFNDKIHFSPVCVLMCIFRLQAKANFFPQTWHVVSPKPVVEVELCGMSKLLGEMEGGMLGVMVARGRGSWLVSTCCCDCLF